MSNRLLKVKIPYPDKNTTQEEALNYLIKTINSATIEEEDDGVIVSGTYTGAGGGGEISTITLNHDLGITPSGFIILDLSVVVPSGHFLGDTVSMARTSWTATQITVTIFHNVRFAHSGSFKLKVLR